MKKSKAKSASTAAAKTEMNKSHKEDKKSFLARQGIRKGVGWK